MSCSAFRARIDVDELKRLGAGRWERILAALAPPLSAALERPGRHVPCPVHGGSDGFRVFKDVCQSGGGICNTCGPFADGFALLGWVNGWDFPTTLREVSAWLTGAPQEAPVVVHRIASSAGREDAALARRLMAVWRGTLPADHAAAQPLRRYLARRGLHGLPRAAVRFHPSLRYYDEDRVLVGTYPGMVARVCDPAGKFVTLHRTYLTADGGKADVASPKKLMAHPGTFTPGAAIHLGTAGTLLGVAEGIETALAVTELTGTVCWACVSDTILRGFVPPAGVTRVVVFGDRDRNQAGQNAARALVERLWKLGLRASVRLAPLRIPEGAKGVDWLDALNARNTRPRQASCK